MRALNGESVDNVPIIVRQNDTATERTINVTARPLWGRFEGGVVVLHDITEQKQAEQKLQESEARFRLIVEGAKDYGIFMLDTARKRRDLERRSRTHHGIRGRRNRGTTLLLFLSAASDRRRLSRKGIARRGGGGTLRGRRLADPQGRLPLLGQRRHRGAPRRVGPARGILENHPRPHRSQERRIGPRAGPRRGRGGQPGQERVPRQHEPRDPHADERHHRHDGTPARLGINARAAGIARPRDGVGRISDDGHQRHPRLLQGRGGKTRTRPDRVQPRAISSATRSKPWRSAPIVPGSSWPATSTRRFPRSWSATRAASARSSSTSSATPSSSRRKAKSSSKPASSRRTATRAASNSPSPTRGSAFRRKNGP